MGERSLGVFSSWVVGGAKEGKRPLAALLWKMESLTICEGGWQKVCKSLQQ